MAKRKESKAKISKTEQGTSETKPLKQEKHSNDKKSSKKVLIITLSVVFVAIIVVAIVLFFIFRKLPDISTEKIMDNLVQEIPTITDVKNYSEADDPNGIMGDSNKYTSKSSWNDSRISNIAEEYAGTIEVFRNTKDAELREWHINKTLEACNNKIRSDIYGDFMNKTTCGALEYGTMYREGTVFVRLSKSFTQDQIAEYKTVLDRIINKFVVPELDVPSDEKIAELKKYEETQIEESFADVTELEKGLDDIAKTYSDRLDEINESLGEKELAAAKEELDFFKGASYYADKLAEFENKIKDIENKIAAQKKAAEEQAAREAAEELAKKNRTLSAGKYKACTDIESGTYDISAISGSGNLFVHSDSLSHYVNELLSADESYKNYGHIKEYKNAILSCGDILEIKMSLVVSLTAKR